MERIKPPRGRGGYQPGIKSSSRDQTASSADKGTQNISPQLDPVQRGNPISDEQMAATQGGLQTAMPSWPQCSLMFSVHR